jgi:hypothetical protein
MSDERERWRGGQWQQFWPEQPGGQRAEPETPGRQPEQSFENTAEAVGDSDGVDQAD